MDMEIAAYIVLGAFALFLLIANAVKIATREALEEFRQDIMSDIKQLISENQKKNSNSSDNVTAGNEDE